MFFFVSFFCHKETPRSKWLRLSKITGVAFNSGFSTPENLYPTIKKNK